MKHELQLQLGYQAPVTAQLYVQAQLQFGCNQARVSQLVQFMVPMIQLNADGPPQLQLLVLHWHAVQLPSPQFPSPIVTQLQLQLPLLQLPAVFCWYQARPYGAPRLATPSFVLLRTQFMSI